LLRYRCAILKKANAKANNFRGLERTMPSAFEAPASFYTAALIAKTAQIIPAAE
jgi:hypothetical protein